MIYAGKLFARVGDEGNLAFVRFGETLEGGWERYHFTIVWSDGRERLPTGETGVVHRIDIDEMVRDGTLYEVNESTSLCPKASACTS